MLPSMLWLVLLAAETIYALRTGPYRYRRLSSRGGADAALKTKDCSDHDLMALADLNDLHASSMLTCSEGLRSFQKLLDPEEAHAELLRSGAWLQEWFHGVSKTSDLGLCNISELLNFILFPERSMDTTKQLLRQVSLSFISTLGLDINDDTRNDEMEDCPEAVELVQARTHQPDTEGKGQPDVGLIARSKTRLMASYRPFSFYAVTETVAGCSHIQLTRRMGYRVDRKTPLATFYARKPRVTVQKAFNDLAQQPAIIFLHGIGLGLMPYTAFLRRLVAEHPGSTVIAVQTKHISMRITASIPTATEVADEIASYLLSRGIAKVSVIGHSYGTLVASALTKRHPTLVAGLMLIDPVCFAMWLPHFISNTIHFDAQRPIASVTHRPSSPHRQSAGLSAREVISRRLKPIRSLMNRLMKGLISRELHCAAAISGRFDWRELNLWTSDLPTHTTVVLGGRDNMIPADQIHQLLTSQAAVNRGVKVMYDPGLGHGSFLLHPELQKKIALSLFPTSEQYPKVL